MKRLRPSVKVLPYLLVAPAVIILTVFYLYPILYNIYLSFFTWNMRGPMKFAGLSNYAELFSGQDFLHTLLNTLLYMVMDVGLVMVLAMGLALFLQKTRP